MRLHRVTNSRWLAWVLFAVLVALGSTLISVPAAHAAGTLVSAPDRKDMAYDANTDVLYIAGGDRVLCYDLSSGEFGPPIVLGGDLWGVDLSADGLTLAVADAAYSTATNRNWIHLVDLETRAACKVEFTRNFGEGGTYAVAFGSDGAVLVTSNYLGSGWVPMRRYDPATEATTQLASVRQRTMLTPSAGRDTVAFAEANLSSGPWGRYRVPDGHLQRMEGYAYGTSSYNFDIAVDADATCYAIPAGSYLKLYGSDLLIDTSISVNAGGVVFAPDTDLLFASVRNTAFVRAYNPQSTALLSEYNVGVQIGTGVRDGRLEAASDGSAVFCAVPGGVVILPLGTGWIDGRIYTDEAHTVPFDGMTVTAVDESTGRRRSATTDAQGYFKIMGLPASASQHTLVYDPYQHNAAHDTDFVAGQYDDDANPAAGPLVVAVNSTIEDDWSEQGGRITGAVRDVLSSAPVPGICVRATWGSGSTRAVVGASGVYTVHGVETGPDVLVTFDPSTVNATTTYPFLLEYWQDVHTQGEATLVQAGATGIDAVMETADFIDGHVYLDDAHTIPFAGLRILVLDNATDAWREGLTNAEGYFRIPGLADSAQGYRVFYDTHAYNVANDTDYVGRWYSATGASDASPLAVAVDSTIDDAWIRAGGRITGVISDLTTGANLGNMLIGADWGASGHAWGQSTSDGRYTVHGVEPSTDVRVIFDPSVVNSTATYPYLWEYWQDVHTPGEATPVQAGATGINAKMETADFIGGHVYLDEAYTIPFEGLRVVVTNNVTGAWRESLVDAEGYFRIPGLADSAQGYRVFFDTRPYNIAYDTDYVGRWYSATGASDASPLAVSLDTTLEDSWIRTGGRIAGTVSDLMTGIGLQNIRVSSTWGSSGNAWSVTAANGTYVVRGVEAGTDVLVKFDPSTANATTTLPYLVEYWRDVHTPGEATLVRAGATGIDAVLETADYIDGHVYLDEARTIPFEGLRVLVLDNASDAWWEGISNADGYYRIAGLDESAEGYTVFYDTHSYNVVHDTDYLGGLYVDSAAPDVVPAVVHPDTTLESDWFWQGGRITGTVRDAQKGQPIANVLVGADWGFSGHAWGITGPDGRYTVHGVPTERDLRVTFDPTLVNEDAEMPFLWEYWRNVHTPARATTVRAGATGVDASLDPMFEYAEDTDPRWQYYGSWGSWASSNLSGGTYRYTNSPGAKCTLRYTGSDMYLVGRVGPDFGVARVYVDGEEVGYLDFFEYYDVYQELLCWIGPLEYGPHEITLEWTGYADPDARNSFINVDVALVDLTPDLIPPDAPTGLTAVGGPKLANMSWAPVADATSYRVYRDGEPIAETTETKFTASGLSMETDYQFTVTALDAALNESDPATPVSAVTWPQETRIEQTDRRFAFAGSWSAYNHAALSGSSYVYSGAANAQGTLTFSGTRCAIVARTGPEFGTIRVLIDGVNKGEVSLWSNATRYQQTVFISDVLPDATHTVTFVNVSPVGRYINVDAIDTALTPDTTPPSSPAGLTASAAGATAIDVSWSAVADATKYRLYKGDGTFIIEKTTTSYQVTGLSPQTLYDFKVTALDESGNESAFAGPVSATTSKQLLRLEQEDSRITRVGPWSTFATADYSGGSYIYSNMSGSGAVVEFYGTQLDLLVRKGPEFGIMAVSVDGGAPADIDLYHSSTLYQYRRYSTCALAEGWHTVKFSWTGRKNAAATNTYVNIDAIEISEIPLQARRFEQGGAGFSSTGSWATWGSTALSGGSYAYTNTSGSSATFAFNGTGFSLVARKGPEFGKANVSVDGNAAVNVDLYSPTGLYQQTVFRSAALSDGPHSVTIAWTGARNSSATNTYINIDAFDAVLSPDVTPPVPPTALAVTSVSSTSVDLAWSGVVDAVKYRVYCDGLLAGETVEPKFQVAQLASLTQYAFKVTAVDEAGNESGYSAEVSGSTTEPAVRLEQNDSRITMAPGAWTTWGSASLSGGSYAYANSADAVTVVEFYGTGCELIARTGPEFGKLSVSIDGAAPTDVELYSASSAFKQKVASYGSLSSGWHTMKLAWSGRKNAAATNTYVNLDAVDVVSAALQAQRIDQADSAKCTLSGPWVTWSTRALASGSYAYTNAVGAKAVFTFNGQGFSLVARKGPEFGKANVVIDGAPPVEIDLYAATSAFQQTVYRSAPLTSGVHTVEIRWTGERNDSASNTYINVDAIDVMAALP